MTGGRAAAGDAALHVDWTRCRGRGLCTELFAERLARDEWGYPIARDGGGTRDVPVRPDERAAAADAVAMCPLQALRLVER
ncbi:ferredoxin [Curtobacterium sp. VKM Ac-1393]|uniref:ferredoxin n=1 Tax=Curtobacterium sp. VKM Ac-1393 TaxID=2783814 RepID=UPI00188B700A|nr:ferredoxin [Curtobacterium sp. VKM Ac-1393]MBF4607234.1 ferredoxin [Curtobacterium sp. VKM Ac-1393]